MPKETFWDSATATENDGVSEPVLTVTWHENDDGVYLNGVKFDYSGIERLAKTLRRATGKDRTVHVTLVADTAEYDAAITESTKRVRELNDELARGQELARDPFAAPARETITTDANAEVTTPVSQEVADAIQRVAGTTRDALAIALAPYGLHPSDIAVPRYERIVYKDEIK